MKTENYIDRIRSFNLDPQVQKCSCIYDSKSFLDLLSVTRREMSHSAFLGEMLKSESFHGLGNYPLTLFLQVILSRAIKQKTTVIDSRNRVPVIFPQLESAILTQKLNPSNISVVPEYCFNDIDEKNSGRVDLLVSCGINVKRDVGKPVRALNIIIENKVYASEQDQQTSKYYNHFNKLLKYKASKKVGEAVVERELAGPLFRYNLYVYLTPLETRVLDTLDRPQSVCQECVQINYQDLVDGVIEPLLSHPNLAERGRFILEEYLRSLSVSFAAVEEDPNNTNQQTRNKLKKIQQVILAVGKEEKDNLTWLWNEYGPLLKAAIEEKNTESDEEEVDNNNGWQYFTYNGQRYLMGPLVEAVISDLVNEYSSQDLIDKFSQLKGIRVLNPQYNTAYFDKPAPPTKDGISLYIKKGWNKKNFSMFREFVKKELNLRIEEYSEPQLPSEERICLREFYDAHEKLITTTLEVIKRTSCDKAIQEEAESMLKRSFRRRERTTYSLTLFDGTVLNGLSKGRLILSVIRDFAKNKPDSGIVSKSFGLPDYTFKKWDGTLKGNSGYFTDNEERILLNDGEFIINHYCADKDIKSFISKAKKLKYIIDQE